MNRIEAIYQYIDEDDKVIDVGCDQAKLSILLAKRNQSSIASDISEKVILKAKENNNSPLIDFRVSDGLNGVKENEVDTLVLSGMGTYTIIDILSKTKLRFKKIITISNNYHDILRREMNELNYKVIHEKIVKENNKYYNLIVFSPGKYNYSEEELILGVNHEDIKMYTEYLEFLLNKYLNIKNKSKNKNKKIDKIIKYLNDKLDYIK